MTTKLYEHRIPLRVTITRLTHDRDHGAVLIARCPECKTTEIAWHPYLPKPNDSGDAWLTTLCVNEKHHFTFGESVDVHDYFDVEWPPKTRDAFGTFHEGILGRRSWWRGKE